MSSTHGAAMLCLSGSNPKNTTTTACMRACVFASAHLHLRAFALPTW